MKTTYENWEVEITFRVSGRARVGADGLVRGSTNTYTLHEYNTDYCIAVLPAQVNCMPIQKSHTLFAWTPTAVPTTPSNVFI